MQWRCCTGFHWLWRLGTELLQQWQLLGVRRRRRSLG